MQLLETLGGISVEEGVGGEGGLGGVGDAGGVNGLDCLVGAMALLRGIYVNSIRSFTSVYVWALTKHQSMHYCSKAISSPINSS